MKKYYFYERQLICLLTIILFFNLIKIHSQNLSFVELDELIPSHTITTTGKGPYSNTYKNTWGENDLFNGKEINFLNHNTPDII